MVDDLPVRLGRIIDRHRATLELYARSFCDCPADVVQETLIKLATLQTWPDPIEPWLYRVTRNTAIAASRSGSRRRRREHASAVPEASFDASDARLDAQDVSIALAGLSQELREIIVARVWGGLTLEQIAAATSLSISSVHRRYRAGLEQLREKLGAECSTPTNGPKN